MLLRFRFSNFRSFRSEQEFSMIAGPFSDMPEAIFHPPGLDDDVLGAAAIYGANASGKTNVLQALEFMTSAVESSHRDWKPDGPIPLEPFGLDDISTNTPSTFAADFLIGNTRYQYGFTVNSTSVLEEWLHAYPKGKKQTWFSRTAAKLMKFSTRMSGENKAIEKLTRKNSLFLSAAAQNNHESLMPIYKWFTHHVIIVTSDRSKYGQLTPFLCTYDEDLRKLASELVSIADLGIVSLNIQKRTVPEATFSTVMQRRAKLRPGVPAQHPASPMAGQALAEIQLLHRAGKENISFKLSQESDGTVAYLSLLGPILVALSIGAVLCIDELDASLHPLLSLQMIRVFNEPSNNPKAAQLIFTTHDTNLLSSGTLRRDQIWFTEKSRDAESHLYPLSDFKPRKEENLEKGYLQGRYGAVPFINSDAFLASLTNDDGKK